MGIPTCVALYLALEVLPRNNYPPNDESEYIKCEIVLEFCLLSLGRVLPQTPDAFVELPKQAAAPGVRRLMCRVLSP